MNRIWLGNRIREARERKHLTQEYLSELVDISPTHMSVIERGVKGMKLSTFIKVANALGVSADELLQDELTHETQVHSGCCLTGSSAISTRSSAVNSWIFASYQDIFWS